MFEQSAYGFDDGFVDGTFVEDEYFVGIESKLNIVGDAGVVVQVFFVGLHDLEEGVAGELKRWLLFLFLEGCECEVAGDVIADDEVIVAEFEPLSFYAFVLKNDVEAFFEFVNIFGAVLTDDAEDDGQVGVIRSQAFLQVLRSADLVEVFSCSQDIYTFTILYLLHVLQLARMRI